MDARLSRRSFIGALVGGAAAASLGCGGADSRSGLDARVSRLLVLFDRPDSAAAVGREYLREHPDEVDVSTLLAALDSAGPRSLHEWLRWRQAHDFEHGQTVTVQGWVLARTEARLCVLAALA